MNRKDADTAHRSLARMIVRLKNSSPKTMGTWGNGRVSPRPSPQTLVLGVLHEAVDGNFSHHVSKNMEVALA